MDTDWCVAGASVLDAECCYVLPEARSDELLIYLHGIVPSGESAMKTNFESIVVEASRSAGVAALIPRGVRGLAPKAFPNWWGWPTSAGTYEKYHAELVQRLNAKRAKLEQLVGAKFRKSYLAGSSSGAYFVGLLALRGGMRADGYGLMSGGSGRTAPELAELTPVPLYVGYGKYDSSGAAAAALGKSFEKAGWPVRIAEHPVGHGAKRVYVDEAIAFWRSRGGKAADAGRGAATATSAE